MTNDAANNLSETLISRYREALEKLEQAKTSHPSPKLVLDLLLARDEIERLQISQNSLPAEALLELIELDKRLQSQASNISKIANLTEWRKSIKPRSKRWWWSSSEEHPLDRLDWLFQLGTTTFIVVFLSLTVNIVPRFWAGGPSLEGAFAAVIPSLLSLLVGKESLDQASRSQAFFERILDKLRAPNFLWKEIEFIGTLIVFGIMVWINCSLPKIAKDYYCKALAEMQDVAQREYEQAIKRGDCKEIERVQIADPYKQSQSTNSQQANSGKLVSPKLANAESSLKVAIALNPDYTEAHLLLGWLYELRQDLEEARREYKIAMQGGSVLGRVRLAKFYILDNQPKSADIAAAILLQGKTEAESSQDKEEKQSWYTALGWARLQQKRYDDALKELEQARRMLIEIIGEYEKEKPEDKPGTVAFCLYAEVLETQNKKEKALNDWRDCYTYSNESDPDEDIWRYKAMQRAKAAGRLK